MEDLTGDDLPLNPADLRMDTQVVSLEELLRKLWEGELQLPSEAAGIVPWSAIEASRFVESLLARIPTPDFYFDATHEAHWSVIDGVRRLLSLKTFVHDKALTLEGLELFPDLNGLSYSKLPRSQSRRIEEAQVTVHLVEKGTPAGLTLGVYRRLHGDRRPRALLAARHAGRGWRRAETLVQSLPLATPGVSLSLTVEQALRLFAVSIAPEALPPPVRSVEERVDWALSELGELEEDAFATVQTRMYAALQSLASLAPDEGAFSTISQSPARLEAWVAALVRRAPSETSPLPPGPEATALPPAQIAALESDAGFLRAAQERTMSEDSLRVRISSISALLAPVLPG